MGLRREGQNGLGGKGAKMVEIWEKSGKSKGKNVKLMVLKCEWVGNKSKRTLALPAEWTLADLHTALQTAFGWEFSHLYEFENADGTHWEDQSPFADMEDLDEDRDSRRPEATSLGEAFPSEKSRLDYTYDFGDCNEVAIVRQKDVEGDGAACLAASGLMAVEDSGGLGFSPGIAAILKKGPKHRDYEDAMDWLGLENENDAEDYLEALQADAEAITAELARIKPVRRKAKRRRK